LPARSVTSLLCGLFLLSGTSALLFETLWLRLAGLAFGNSVWASSLVLSSFMAGLAVGNLLVPRLARRWPAGAMLRGYALLELLIGISGLALVRALVARFRAHDPAEGWRGHLARLWAGD